MKGFITRKGYTVTTVFVDHFRGLSFRHLQKSSPAAETIEAKHAFERFVKTHGIYVKHYPAVKGIFAEPEFINAVNGAGQTPTTRKGGPKRKSEIYRTTGILHASQRCPTAVSVNLCPYAMLMANDVSNFSPAIKSGVCR
jgi:hypothetical protein